MTSAERSSQTSRELHAIIPIGVGRVCVLSDAIILGGGTNETQLGKVGRNTIGRHLSASYAHPRTDYLAYVTQPVSSDSDPHRTVDRQLPFALRASEVADRIINAAAALRADPDAAMTIVEATESLPEIQVVRPEDHFTDFSLQQQSSP